MKTDFAGTFPDDVTVFVRKDLGCSNHTFFDHEITGEFKTVIKRLEKNNWFKVVDQNYARLLKEDLRLYRILSLKTCLGLIESKSSSQDFAETKSRILDQLHTLDGLEPEDGKFCD